MQNAFHSSWTSLNKVELHLLKQIWQHCQGLFSAYLFLQLCSYWSGSLGDFCNTNHQRKPVFETSFLVIAFGPNMERRGKLTVEVHLNSTLQRRSTSPPPEPSVGFAMKVCLKTVGRLQGNCKWKNRRYNGLGNGAGHQ